MSDDDKAAAITELGYTCPCKLASGDWAGLRPMTFTVGLFVGIDLDSYRERYCYPTASSALAALLTWNGAGDPPGPWIKNKGRGIDRANPNRE